jgi:putative restriction endonuclease
MSGFTVFVVLAQGVANEDILRSRSWSRDELLACFNLYCRIPFGKLHKGNPEIIEAAEALHRTPSAVAMKLVNFASFDPAQRSRNVKGLVNASRQDRALWEEFEVDPNSIAARSEEAFDRFIAPGATLEEEAPAPSQGPIEKLLERPMRLVQSFIFLFNHFP